MNKGLILEVVSSIIEFNESQKEYDAGIQFDKDDAWVYIFSLNGIIDYVFSERGANEENLENFIEKLNELKGDNDE